MNFRAEAKYATPSRIAEANIEDSALNQIRDEG